MSPDRIEKLEKIGFTWDRLDKQFEKGFQETLLYKKNTDNPNAPTIYKTAEGYHLGRWQSMQRNNYKKGTISPDRIKRLEEIGFNWEMTEKHEDSFEKGVQETLLYKKNTGNPNTPKRYKTPDGFRLGSWQTNQRGNYRKGKLSPDRIKRLEDIEFKWRSSD